MGTTERAELPAGFPLLHILDARPHNLPVQRTLLIGRERELAAIQHALTQDDVALLTLTGPGGTGKTRLALQAAAEAWDQFDDGAVVVPLGPISEPDLVLPT